MNNKELVAKYPFMKYRSMYTGKLSEDDRYTWFDEIPEGWRKAFGFEMVEELYQILKKANYVDKYEIAQIKEKFGALRWYSNGVPEEIRSEYRDWIMKYEYLSKRVCIICGAPATKISTGWISPFCDDCVDQKHPERYVDIDECEE